MAPMSQSQREETKDIAELEVRRYFDEYLNDIFPKQLEKAIEHHNTDNEAHGGVQMRMGKMIALLIGIAGASGGGAALLPQIMSALFGW